MILKYERACEEACRKEDDPMDEKSASKVRNYLDGQKKNVRRKKKTKEKRKIVFNSLEKMVETGEFGEDSMGTTTEDALEMMIHSEDMEKLHKCMEQLSAEDREIILTIYGCDDKKVNIKRASEILNMKRTTVSDAHKRILGELRKNFFKKEGKA